MGAGGFNARVACGGLESYPEGSRNNLSHFSTIETADKLWANGPLGLYVDFFKQSTICNFCLSLLSCY